MFLLKLLRSRNTDKLVRRCWQRMSFFRKSNCGLRRDQQEQVVDPFNPTLLLSRFRCAATLLLLITSALPASARVYYVHADHLGTPIAMTDDQQEVVWQARYDPFGNTVIDASSEVELNLRFLGQYFDKESGLHHNYFRDYDPTTGRYTQSDPIGLEGGINTYAYSLNNPINYSDPYGLWVMRCARKLGEKTSAPVYPSGNPLRHDYISVSGSILSFQAGGTSVQDMISSQGRLDKTGEFPTNAKCSLFCGDDKFDKYAFEAATEIGEPTYCVWGYPGTGAYKNGSRNCQTWADDVLELAKRKYLANEDCPDCFK